MAETFLAFNDLAVGDGAVVRHGPFYTDDGDTLRHGFTVGGGGVTVDLEWYESRAAGEAASPALYVDSGVSAGSTIVRGPYVVVKLTGGTGGGTIKGLFHTA